MQTWQTGHWGVLVPISRAWVFRVPAADSDTAWALGASGLWVSFVAQGLGSSWVWGQEDLSVRKYV